MFCKVMLREGVGAVCRQHTLRTSSAGVVRCRFMVFRAVRFNNCPCDVVTPVADIVFTEWCHAGVMVIE